MRRKGNKQNLGIRLRKKEEREMFKEQLIESLPNLIWIIAITLIISFFASWSIGIIAGISMLFGFAIGYEQGRKKH